MTNLTAKEIIYEMPLKQVFVWEQVFLEKNGWTCLKKQTEAEVAPWKILKELG